jgi:hypothetical protein
VVALLLDLPFHLVIQRHHEGLELAHECFDNEILRNLNNKETVIDPFPFPMLTGKKLAEVVE